ncbi:hypothetical protein [Sphingomonas glaciei]|uniref:Uncharacterized protein n=1 Tax=Sphingomonas glaciei TaxID=2938948 RepID=A0ABY5MY40_9SPHN|nr:hypothetical protein [Sphingomonas glaciei]UUR07276.1 hypothetical protein M1K48_10015 [Sphingomonas glaciei]
MAVALFVFAPLAELFKVPVFPHPEQVVDSNFVLNLTPFFISVVTLLLYSKRQRFSLPILLTFAAGGLIYQLLQWPWGEYIPHGDGVVVQRALNFSFTSDALYAAGYGFLLVSGLTLVAASRSKPAKKAG